MKKYTFTACTLTACGPNFPEGKTFPARYELQDSADMKRGQLAPVVHIFATVDEKTVKIDVPSDDEYYSAALHAAQEAAKLCEQPAQEETPADHSNDEQPAPETVEKRYFEVGYDTGVCFSVNIIWTDCKEAEKAARAMAERHAKRYGYSVAYLKEAEENSLRDNLRKGMPLVKADGETPADPSDDKQPSEAEPEQPSRDPKQARGEIPEKTFAGTSIKGARYEIIFDAETQRTRVIIPAEYRDAARATIEKAGFYYSAPLDSWNKKLTFRAYRAAVALAAELEKVLAA